MTQQANLDKTQEYINEYYGLGLDKHFNNLKSNQKEQSNAAPYTSLYFRTKKNENQFEKR